MSKIPLYKVRFISLIVLFFLPFYSFAQEDFNTWSVVQLKYEAIEKFDFTIEGQLRLKENSKTVDAYFGEFGISYKLPYNFNIGAGLRYIRENDNRGNIQGYENHLRYNFDLSYRHSIDRLKLKYRFRYQHKNELGLNDIANQRLRLKTTSTYNIRSWKLDPEFSAEIFNRIGKKGENTGFDQYRIGLGTTYSVKNIGKFSLHYFYEKEFNVTDPDLRHIVRLKYSYSIK